MRRPILIVVASAMISVFATVSPAISQESKVAYAFVGLVCLICLIKSGLQKGEGL